MSDPNNLNLFHEFVTNDFNGLSFEKLYEYLIKTTPHLRVEELGNYINCKDFLLCGNNNAIHVNAKFRFINEFFKEKLAYKLRTSKNYNNQMLFEEFIKCIPKPNKSEREKIYRAVCADPRFMIIKKDNGVDLIRFRPQNQKTNTSPVKAVEVSSEDNTTTTTTVTTNNNNSQAPTTISPAVEKHNKAESTAPSVSTEQKKEKGKAKQSNANNNNNNTNSKNNANNNNPNSKNHANNNTNTNNHNNTHNNANNNTATNSNTTNNKNSTTNNSNSNTTTSTSTSTSNSTPEKNHHKQQQQHQHVAKVADHHETIEHISENSSSEVHDDHFSDMKNFAGDTSPQVSQQQLEHNEVNSMQIHHDHHDHPHISNGTAGKKVVEQSVSLSAYLRFSSSQRMQLGVRHGCSLATKQVALRHFPESALLGYAAFATPYIPSSLRAAVDMTHMTQVTHEIIDDEVYLNTHEPFCLVTVGVSGSGKSQTVGCVLESCLLPIAQDNLINLQTPMTALVFHYDHTSSTSICEATGLISPNLIIQNIFGQTFSVPREQMIVLVSPMYYRQRKAFYGNYCIVKPLLFHWSCLTADHIKRIMRISSHDPQQSSYAATVLDLLRDYQKNGKIPKFQEFLSQVRALCQIQGQEQQIASALQQRIKLLESIIIDDDSSIKFNAKTSNNKLLDAASSSGMDEVVLAQGCDLYDVCNTPGKLIIVDLTDPLLAREEANGIFQVLAEQFRVLPNTQTSAKVLVLDEADKYMDGGASSYSSSSTTEDGLSRTIVDIARSMRREGIRLVVSTQSPRALAPELLEFVSVAVMHRFHSRDWFQYLRSHLLLPEKYMQQVAKLDPGHALVFVSRHLLGKDEYWSKFADYQEDEDEANNVFPITIRPRVTAADRGQR